MHLVINSYGATLIRENGLFVIQTEEGKQSFPPDIVKSISISKAARITSDAIILAIHHQVDVLFVSDTGNPEGRVWSVKYGSISNIRRAQLNFLYSPAVIPWVKEMIYEKLDSQVALLMTIQPPKDVLPAHNLIKSAINSIEDYKDKVKNLEAQHLSDISPTLRGWEGAASKRYFQGISSMMPDRFNFEIRDRMPAKDPFNSLLNYAYGMLYSKVEGALIKAGVDPYVGIFHRDDFNRPALVYDMIEKYRAWMDYVVIQLCSQEAIPAKAFEKSTINEGILLGPLAKRILIQSVNDYLGEIIPLGNRTVSRQSHIDLQMQALAQFFTKTASL
jgi:CRISPR-associated protein Cas1